MHQFCLQDKVERIVKRLIWRQFALKVFNANGAWILGLPDAGLLQLVHEECKPVSQPWSFKLSICRSFILIFHDPLVIWQKNFFEKLIFLTVHLSGSAHFWQYTFLAVHLSDSAPVWQYTFLTVHLSDSLDSCQNIGQICGQLKLLISIALLFYAIIPYYYELLLCDAISLYYLRYTLTVRSLLVKLLSIYY